MSNSRSDRIYAFSRLGRPTLEQSRSKLANTLMVARELFCELGYRAVSMRLVAERAQISTRTLYNRYADKLSLFRACLDIGATRFPVLRFTPHTDVRSALETHATALVEMLSSDASLQLSMLIFREAGEFPELLGAAEDNQEQYLVQPLATYLLEAGLVRRPDAHTYAELFIALALSEWQRRTIFRRPMSSPAEISAHARRATRVFLDGVRNPRS